MSSSPLKIITLTCFVSMIGLFLAYRTGAFTHASANDAITANASMEQSTSAIDTPPVITNEDTMRVIMSSSKSAPIFDRPVQDTTKKKKPVSNQQKTASDTSKKKQAPKKMIMGGSKSGYIYDPENPPNPKDTL